MTKLISIVGGTGYLGRQIVARLAAKNTRVRVVSRTPREIPSLSTVEYAAADCMNPQQLLRALDGSTHVVNLVGLLYEIPRKNQLFQTVHVDGTKNILDCVMKLRNDGLQTKFVHMSSLGVSETSSSSYSRTKGLAERLVLETVPNATILRPSLIIGPAEGDGFFNKFYDMAKFSPFLPLVGGGLTKFQPVDVLDVARACEHVLGDSNGRYAGKTIDIGGPETFTFRQLLDALQGHTRMRRLYLNIPFSIAKIQGLFMETLLEHPPLTKDQVVLLASGDNVVPAGTPHLTLADLGIHPNSLREVLGRWEPKTMNE